MLLRLFSRGAARAVISAGFRGPARHLRALSTIPLHYQQQYQQEAGPSSVLAEEAAAVPQEEAIPFTFESTFHASKASDIYTVQEGGYVDLEAKDIKQYFPEGLAGEMDAEFEYSGRKSWMIRDSAKLLCRLVDDFDANRRRRGESSGSGSGSINGGSSSGSISSSSNSSSSGSSSISSSSTGGQAVYKAVSLPSLTDRPEWASASMSVSHFGSELMPAPADTIANPSRLRRTGTGNVGGVVQASPVMAVARGEGSLVDKCLQRLREVSGSDAVPAKIMLTGPRGVGKSAALNQMVMHARKRGWLCLFVPRGWDQVQSGSYVEPVAPLRGESARGVLDNPFMSAQVLRGLWMAHSAHLNALPLQFPKETDKYRPYLAKFQEAYDRAKSVSGREKMGFRQMREIVDGDDHVPEQDALDAAVLDGFDYASFSSELKSLGDLCRLGVAFRDLAGSVVMDLVAELRVVESVSVLVAVDEYNAWEAPSAFSYRSEAVQGRQICVPHSLRFVSKRKAETEAWTLRNGLCVCATSLSHPEGRKETFEDVKSSIPLVVRVPAYSRVEFLSAITYYMHQGLVAPGTTAQELLAFRMLAGSNPFVTRKEAVPFFFPISVGKLGSDISAMGTTDETGEHDADGGDVERDTDNNNNDSASTR